MTTSAVPSAALQWRRRRSKQRGGVNVHKVGRGRERGVRLFVEFCVCPSFHNAEMRLRFLIVHVNLYH